MGPGDRSDDRRARNGPSFLVKSSDPSRSGLLVKGRTG
jgi:hypothetical protein